MRLRGVIISGGERRGAGHCVPLLGHDASHATETSHTQISGMGGTDHHARLSPPQNDTYLSRGHARKTGRWIDPLQRMLQHYASFLCTRMQAAPLALGTAPFLALM